MRTLLALVLICGSAFAQSFPLAGGMTDSSVTINTPTIPGGAQTATLALHHEARFRAGTETDLVIYEGDGWCEFAASSVITQGITMHSLGAQLGSAGRAKATFAQAGMCLPFDGVYDWGGASGWNSGYVVRPNSLSVTVPVAQLGPTITVTTLAQSTTDIVIACYATVLPYDILGRLIWSNESWWSGNLTVSFN